ncbi:hypothetical protein ACS0TY_008971 [Phlomoides rotata]
MFFRSLLVLLSHLSFCIFLETIKLHRNSPSTSIHRRTGVEGVTMDMTKNEVTIKGVIEPQAVCNRIMKKQRERQKFYPPCLRLKVNQFLKLLPPRYLQFCILFYQHMSRMMYFTGVVRFSGLGGTDR